MALIDFCVLNREAHKENNVGYLTAEQLDSVMDKERNGIQRMIWHER
jgi:hypothetical protein